MPALLVCLWVATIATLLLVPVAWLGSTNVVTARAAHVGLSNLSLIQESTNYFSAIADYNPYTHTWSLAVEEQFYVLFPFLFFLWLKGGHLKVVTALLVFALSLASLVFARLNPNETVVFYSILSRFWELGIGVLSYQFVRSENFRKYPLQKYRKPLALVLLLMIVVSFWLPLSGAPTGPASLIAVLGTAMLLLVLENEPGGMARNWLSTPWVRYIGKISYSLYLYHWVIFVLFRWTVGLQGPLQIFSALLLSFGFAFLSFNFIENKTRLWVAGNNFSQGKIIITGILVLFGSSKLTKYVYQQQSKFSLSVTGQQIADWYPERAEISLDGCTAIYAEGEGFAGQYLRSKDCPQFKYPKKYFVLGDSHVGGYVPVFKMLALKTGAEVRFYSSGGCAMLPMNGRTKDLGKDCSEFLEKSRLEILSLAGPNDVLFLPALRLSRFGTQFRTQENPNMDLMAAPIIENRRLAVEDAKEELTPFLKKGMSIVVELPKPIFRISPYRCFDWFNKNNPECRYGFTMDRNFLLKFREPVVLALQKVAQENPGVRLWDPFEALCPETDNSSCDVVKNGKSLFFDQDHLSGYGSHLLTNSLLAFVL